MREGPGRGAPEGEVYGLLALSGATVALPLSALREVVPCPPEFSPLPVVVPGLVGAMELRELVVPVVDLAATSGGGERAGGEHQVVVLVSDGHHLQGVLAEQVRGVVRVPAAELMELEAEGGPLLFSHAFRGEAGIVSVLDPSRVLSLPGMPRVRDRPAAPAATGREAGEHRTLTLLRAGRRLLALDVADVHTTLPSAAPRPSVVSGGACLGVTAYSGKDVAVVDPLRLLGLVEPDEPRGGPGGEPAAGLGEAGLVLALEPGHVVLALSALVGLVEVDRADRLPLAAFSVARPDLLAGMVDLPDHGPCLVLDGKALLRDPSLLELAATNTPAPGAPEPPAAGHGPGARAGTTASSTAPADGPPSTYLTYRAGTALATPLGQVVEILPMPAPEVLAVGGTGAGPAGPAVRGIMAHRGQALPVLDLPTLLGTRGGGGTQEAADGCLLVVAVGEGHVGFAVDGLHEIEPLSWCDPGPHPERPGSGAGPSGAPHAGRVIQVGASEALLREVDLQVLGLAALRP